MHVIRKIILNKHLKVFLFAFNHAKWLKTLRGLIPHKFVSAQWQKTYYVCRLPEIRPTSRWYCAPSLKLAVNKVEQVIAALEPVKES